MMFGLSQLLLGLEIPEQGYETYYALKSLPVFEHL